MLQGEEWRDSSRVGELAEVEYRSLFSRRLNRFIESESLDEEAAARLVELSAEVLQETPAPREYRDMMVVRTIEKLTGRMVEKSRDVLTDEQSERLQTQLKSRI